MICNNERVVKFTSRAVSRLSKKHQLVYWHTVREAILAGRLRVLRDLGETNLADIFTKQLPIQSQEDILNSIYSCDGKYVRDKK